MCAAGRANHAGGGSPAVLDAVIAENYGMTPPATHYHEGSSGAADGNDRFYGFECENLGDGKDPWPAGRYQALGTSAPAICPYSGWHRMSPFCPLGCTDRTHAPTG